MTQRLLQNMCKFKNLAKIASKSNKKKKNSPKKLGPIYDPIKAKGNSSVIKRKTKD